MVYCVYIGPVQIQCVYSAALAGSSFPHTNINIYNEDHITITLA